MKRPVLLLLAFALILVPLEGFAEPADPPAGYSGGSPDPALESRLRDLDDALLRLHRARQRRTEAEAAYENWRQRKWPRGDRKAEILAAREEARTELEQARAELPRAIERARRDGLPPGELRPYEEAARAEMASR